MSVQNADYVHGIVVIKIYISICCSHTDVYFHWDKRQKKERITVKINIFIWDCVQATELDNLKEKYSQIHRVLYLYSAYKGKGYV